MPSPVLGMNLCPATLAFTITAVVRYVWEQEEHKQCLQYEPVMAHQPIQPFGVGAGLRER